MEVPKPNGEETKEELLSSKGTEAVLIKGHLKSPMAVLRLCLDRHTASLAHSLATADGSPC